MKRTKRLPPLNGNVGVNGAELFPASEKILLELYMNPRAEQASLDG